jgi:AcrR family transcriptional regulator
MSEPKDVRSRRHDWTRAEILAAAWELVREGGIAGLSTRELARKVGMRAPSLYTYFPSKNDLLDAMYAQGMQQMDEHMRNSPPGRTARETLQNRVRTFVFAAAQDPIRYQLLFERPVPGFVPSPQSLAIGLSRLQETGQMALAAGLTPQALDLLMATTRGLVAMQIANEPGGDRWIGLVDLAVDIVATHFAADGSARSRTRKRGVQST